MGSLGNTSMVDLGTGGDTPVVALCWICGDPADSGEHKSKKSDLKTIFGDVSAERPIHFHDGAKLNRKVKSLDADVLKWRKVICHHCNTTRTQPHDMAWERLHSGLRARFSTLKPGCVVRANKIFSRDTARAMLEVHLYFAKAMGCTIAMENAALDIGPFAKAIMTETAHPEFYLNFGMASGPAVSVVQASPIRIWLNPDGTLIHATWFYNVDHLVIEGRLVPGAVAQAVATKQGAWHPRLGTNCLKIVKIES
jgi:hypothetical protein